MNDGFVFKKIMSQYSNARIRQLIDFVFSGHPETKWMADKGYPIRLLPSQLNTFMTALKRPWSSISYKEGDLNVPYYDDYRTEYIWSMIKSSNINDLIDNVTDEHYWDLLLFKLENQLTYIPEKVVIFYERWRSKDRLERTKIKKGKN